MNYLGYCSGSELDFGLCYSHYCYGWRAFSLNTTLAANILVDLDSETAFANGFDSKLYYSDYLNLIARS